MNQQRYEQAVEAGRRARQAGKGRETGPLYEMGDAGQRLRDAWRSGWDAEDQERRKRV